MAIVPNSYYDHAGTGAEWDTGTCTSAWAWERWNSSTADTQTTSWDNERVWRDWNTNGIVYQYEKTIETNKFVYQYWISDERLDQARDPSMREHILREQRELAQRQLDRMIAKTFEFSYDAQTGELINLQMDEVKERINDANIRINRHERRRQRAVAEQKRKEALKKKREAERKLRMERRKREKAERKAMELLEDVIGSEQTKVYKETGRLFVKGEKYDWLIEKQDDKNHLGYVKMRKFRKGKVSDLCVHVVEDPKERLPITDKVLTLALNAKLSEDEFDKTANPTTVGEKKALYPKGFPKAANM